MRLRPAAWISSPPVKGRSILNASAGARRFGPPKVTNTAPWRLLLTICAVSMWPSPSKSTLAETLKRGFVRNASFDVAWRIASDVTGRHASFDGRSEEHTSELQSLMRISYAVFCLKKKKNIHTTQTTSNTYSDKNNELIHRQE